MKWSEYYAGDISLESYLFNLSRHRGFLAEVLGHHPRSILEVGTGTGAMATFLSTLDSSVTAIDNNPDVLEAAKRTCRTFGGHVDFHLMDGFNMTFDADFDIAFSQGLFEHFGDAEARKAAQEQLRVAQRVLISVPSKYYVNPHGDDRLLSLKQWMDILSPFNVEKAVYYEPAIRKGLFFAKLKRHKHPFYIFKPNQIMLSLTR